MNSAWCEQVRVRVGVRVSATAIVRHTMVLDWRPKLTNVAHTVRAGTRVTAWGFHPIQRCVSRGFLVHKRRLKPFERRREGFLLVRYNKSQENCREANFPSHSGVLTCTRFPTATYTKNLTEDDRNVCIYHCCRTTQGITVFIRVQPQGNINTFQVS